VEEETHNKAQIERKNFKKDAGCVFQRFHRDQVNWNKKRLSG
jgi:hypothetical protein